MTRTTNETRNPELNGQEQTGQDRTRPLRRDETGMLISSDKVDGTSVYASDGEKIGHVDHLMIGKRSGQVEYAVMSFGGFLGIGENFHPIPWDALDYDTDRGGYVVNIDKSKLAEAPQFSRSAMPTFDSAFGTQVFGYYGVMY